MPDVTASLLALYAVGALVGLVLADAPIPMRFVLALSWPLGIVAFVLTMTLLLVVACIAFPLVGVVVALLGLALWVF